MNKWMYDYQSQSIKENHLKVYCGKWQRLEVVHICIKIMGIIRKKYLKN